MESRTKKLISYISKNQLDAMYISAYENYRYFSDFTGSNCHLIITRDKKFLITDGRYYTQAKEQAPDWKLVEQKGASEESVGELITELGISKIGYEGTKLTDYQVRSLKKSAAGAEWIPCDDFGQTQRMIKDDEEIKKIERAVEIADKALERLCAVIHAGMTEKQVATELEYFMAKEGSEKPAFETISASGERGAMPHGAPSERKISQNDMLTLDFGACYGGYMSDITRTLWFGNPCAELQKIWHAVYDAQQTAIKAVKPGITAGMLDDIHRKVLEKHGYGEYIMHSLGHGVGLEIHEQPRVSPRSETVLECGMVITIEPGIYVPGLGGVRTEDMVVVTQEGARVLTGSPHLIKIPGGKA